MGIGQNGGHEVPPPAIQLQPIEHILGGCQIIVAAERSPLTGETFKELQAFHPSGHLYKIRFGLEQARQVGRALIKDVTQELDAVGKPAPTPLRDSMKAFLDEGDSE